MAESPSIDMSVLVSEIQYFQNIQFVSSNILYFYLYWFFHILWFRH